MATALSLREVAEQTKNPISEVFAVSSLQWKLPSRRALMLSVTVHIAALVGLLLVSILHTGALAESAPERSRPQHFVLVYRPSKLTRAIKSYDGGRPPLMAKSSVRAFVPTAPQSRDFSAPQAPEIEGSLRPVGILLDTPPLLDAPKLVERAGFDLAGAAHGGGKGRAVALGQVSVGKFGGLGGDQGIGRLGSGTVEVGKFGASSPQRKTIVDGEPKMDDTIGLEILGLPKPQYTKDAREHHIQGTVLIRAAFHADRTVEALAVIHGLGFGLDNNAMEAVRRIRFVPGKSHGEVVEVQILTVKVDFMLAD
jgi:TonB family protein